MQHNFLLLPTYFIQCGYGLIRTKFTEWYALTSRNMNNDNEKTFHKITYDETIFYSIYIACIRRRIVLEKAAKLARKETPL